MGRPRLPVSQVTKDALWKRAQRADGHSPDKGMVRHHLDRSYGRKSPRVVYITRAAHNRLHKRRKKIKRIA